MAYRQIPIPAVPPAAGSYSQVDEARYRQIMNEAFTQVLRAFNDVQDDITVAAGVTALNDLNDVTITAPATSEVLRYSGTAWVDAALAAGDIQSGTFADGRIALSNVTQHQASLSIAESQIPDSTILARVASNETISGVWAFSTDVSVYGDGTTRYIDFAGHGSAIPRLRIFRSLGTKASPTVLTTGLYIGEITAGGYDGSSYDYDAGEIRWKTSENWSTTSHGTDFEILTTPNSSTVAGVALKVGQDKTTEVYGDLYVGAASGGTAGAKAEIHSDEDAKLILRETGASGWNRIDFYEVSDRHGYLGFGTGNEFYLVNEESAAPIVIQSAGGGEIRIDDGGTNYARAASVKAITATTTAPTGDYPYGALHLIY